MNLLEESSSPALLRGCGSLQVLLLGPAKWPPKLPAALCVAWSYCEQAWWDLGAGGVGTVGGRQACTLPASAVELSLLWGGHARRAVEECGGVCWGSQGSALASWQVNKEEETDENETEWLMEEIQPPTPRLGREGQENGHITTKSVKAEALTSLHGDDQDSEDEVLTIPEVKVHSGRGAGAGSAQPARDAQKALQEREDDRVGLVQGGKARKGKPRPGQQKTGTSATLVSFHDDSDEDLLHI